MSRSWLTVVISDAMNMRELPFEGLERREILFFIFIDFLYHRHLLVTLENSLLMIMIIS